MWTLLTVLSPAISIDQKTTSKNPRSTVGTATEINDYLRLALCACRDTLLYQWTWSYHRLRLLSRLSIKVLELPERQRLQILAPVIRKKKGQHKNI